MLNKKFQRDLWSAFLARYVNDDLLSLQDAQLSYPGMESCLMEAWELYQQQTNQVGQSESEKSHSSPESVSVKGKSYRIAGSLKSLYPKSSSKQVAFGGR